MHHDLLAFDPHFSLCIGTGVDPSLGHGISLDVRFRVGVDSILDHVKRWKQSDHDSVEYGYARHSITRHSLIGLATLFDSDVSLACEPEPQRRGRLRGGLHRDHCDLVLRRRMFVSAIGRRTRDPHDGALGGEYSLGS